MSVLSKITKCLPHVKGLLNGLMSVNNIVSTKVQLSGIMGSMLQTEELHMKLPYRTKLFGYPII